MCNRVTVSYRSPIPNKRSGKHKKTATRCKFRTYSHIVDVTAAISVVPFGGKVLAHSANSIAVSKGILDDGIKFNSSAKKSDQSYRNGVDTTIVF